MNRRKREPCICDGAIAFKRPGLRSQGWRTTANRSAAMAMVRQTDTAPELAVRVVLRSLGIRYTTRNRDLPGSPDIANRRRRFVIFVHGCFWHRHTGCRRTTTPTRNRAFWEEKFAANVRRDRRASQALRAAGFKVLTIWECQTLDPSRMQGRISRFFDCT